MTHTTQNATTTTASTGTDSLPQKLNGECPPWYAEEEWELKLQAETDATEDPEARLAPLRQRTLLVHLQTRAWTGIKVGAAVDEFLAQYPAHIEDARGQLGTLFQRHEYPSVTELRGAFRLDFHVFKHPPSEDLRLDLDDTDLEYLNLHRDRAQSDAVAGATAPGTGPTWDASEPLTYESRNRLQDSIPVRAAPRPGRCAPRHARGPEGRRGTGKIDLRPVSVARP